MTWESVGGLRLAALATVVLSRRAFPAETDVVFADLAAERLTACRPRG